MSYKKGERWTISKFDCVCATCGRKIKRGQQIWLDPEKKKAVCCGDKTSQNDPEG